jgi:hypothetical protein
MTAAVTRSWLSCIGRAARGEEGAMPDSRALEAALRLRARGYWPIAIYPKGATKLDGKSTSKDGKDPIGPAWGAEPWTEWRLRDAYRRYPAAGAGVCFGPGRGPGGSWLIDLEGDGPQAAESLAKVLGGELPETPSWASTKGDHAFFTADGERLLSLLAAAGAKEGDGPQAGVYHLVELPDLEWRIGGRKPDDTVKQLQSVVPPTPGTDGKPRTWRVTPRTPPAPLPESVYAYLEQIASAKRAAAGASKPAARGSTKARSDDWHDHQAVLRRACTELACAVHPGRHKTLCSWSITLASRVKGGCLTEREVLDGLHAAAQSNGMLAAGRHDEIADAWRSALEKADTWVDRPSRNGPAASGSAASGTVTACAGDADDDAVPIPEEEWPDPPDAAAYHGLAGNIVQALEPRTEADPAGCLIQTLVAFGSAVGTKPFVRVGETFHHAKENVLVIGGTGASGRKGKGLDDTLPFFAEVDPAWWNNCRASGLSTAEGLIYVVRDAVEGVHHVKEKGRIVETQTVIVDQGVADKRLFITETEFASVLKRASRDGNALTAVIRQAWDGSYLRNMTKGSPYRATGVHACIAAHITPEELLKLLTEVDVANGFANRFLLCCVRRTKQLPFGGRVPQDEMTRLREDLKAAVEFAKVTEEVTWTRAAMDLWEREYPRLTATRAGAFGKATGRAEAHTLRLALHFALLAKSTRIKPEHLEAALAVWDYAERSARHVFGDSSGDRDADRIRAALLAAPDGMTRHEIRRALFDGHKPAKAIAAALGLLLRLQQARRESVETPGRPAERWFAVSACAKSALSAISPPPGDPFGAFGAYGAGAQAENTPPDRAGTDWRRSDPHAF